MLVTNTSSVPLAILLDLELSARYGPMMTGKSLWTALGYPSNDAFRQAIARKTTPITVFSIEKRRGKFALTKEVATWIATQRERAVIVSKPMEGA